jgi:CubicO group peptidase (beta-lactamase class C family)
MIASASVALFSAGCAQLPAAREPQFDGARLAEIDGAINAVIADRRMPGALFHLERNGEVYEKAYGRLSYDAGAAADDAGTVFDAASLTKILATAPSVLLLVEEGKLDLEAPVSRYFPECGGKGKEGMTVRHLLTHSSGLPAGLPALPAWKGQAAARALACAKAVTDTPGTAFRYSDINYILLGQLVQLVSGMPLDEFAQRHIFAPLKMADTGYLPLARFAASRIAPTHISPLLDSEKALHPGLQHGEVLQGVVHDPTSRRMGGVAGSAGVFTTARDLARFARMLLADGELDGVRILSRDSVRLMTTVQSPAGVAQARGMGMDIDSPFARPRGELFPIGSYGHTGFTGCILWVDPNSRTFYVLLSNRVYPDDKSNILPLYNRLGTLAAQSVLGFDFAALKRPLAGAPADKVKTAP